MTHFFIVHAFTAHGKSIFLFTTKMYKIIKCTHIYAKFGTLRTSLDVTFLFGNIENYLTAYGGEHTHNVHYTLCILMHVKSKCAFALTQAHFIMLSTLCMNYLLAYLF